MAKNNNLSDFLTGVADAIRVKKGTSSLINPQDFESEIESISTSKEEQEKSVEITQNGTIVVLPDSGKVLSKVTITVNVEKEPQEYTDCITFTGETSDFTLKATNKEWDGTVEYSTDHNTWAVWDGSEISSIGKKLYLRGSGNTKFYTSNGARFVLSARAACSGNIQTLLQYNNPPTKILVNECYHGMFSNCTNLTTAPELPATTLASNCYYSMFSGCTNLIAAPELPATTLANYCYQFMFYGCTSLRISATQDATYKTVWRIPKAGTISSTKTGWNSRMLSNTGGTFTSDPSENTTYYGAWDSEG